eukprot:scaffold574169_cov46-Prasinocladus_malaysianus.AAC.1
MSHLQRSRRLSTGLLAGRCKARRPPSQPLRWGLSRTLGCCDPGGQPRSPIRIMWSSLTATHSCRHLLR